MELKSKLKKDNPDYALFFACNCCDRVMGKIKNFIERGVRVIFQLSESKIIKP